MAAHVETLATVLDAPRVDDLPPLLTIPQACAYAAVSRGTIYNWIAQGKLTVWRTASGMIRLDRTELIRRESR